MRNINFGKYMTNIREVQESVYSDTVTFIGKPARKRRNLDKSLPIDISGLTITISNWDGDANNRTSGEQAMITITGHTPRTEKIESTEEFIEFLRSYSDHTDANICTDSLDDKIRSNEEWFNEFVSGVLSNPKLTIKDMDICMEHIDIRYETETHKFRTISVQGTTHEGHRKLLVSWSGAYIAAGMTEMITFMVDEYEEFIRELEIRIESEISPENAVVRIDRIQTHEDNIDVIDNLSAKEVDDMLELLAEGEISEAEEILDRLTQNMEE